MITYLAYEVVIKLNYFPVKVGLSPYYIPENIVDRQPLYYKIHVTIPFGEFVQSNNDKNPKIKCFTNN